MSVASAPIKPEAKPSLVAGRSMKCPRCKHRHDVLEYVPLMQLEPELTNAIYKCPGCRWLFSPADPLVIG